VLEGGEGVPGWEVEGLGRVNRMAGMLRAREEGGVGAGAGAGSLGEPVGDVVSGIIHNRAGPMPENPQSQNSKFKIPKNQPTSNQIPLDPAAHHPHHPP